MAPDQLRERLRLARTVVLFVAGIAGIAWETVVSGTDRPTLLILFAAMIGLPFALHADETSGPPSPPSDDSKKTS